MTVTDLPKDSTVQKILRLLLERSYGKRIHTPYTSNPKADWILNNIRSVNYKPFEPRREQVGYWITGDDSVFTERGQGRTVAVVLSVTCDAALGNDSYIICMGEKPRQLAVQYLRTILKENGFEITEATKSSTKLANGALIAHSPIAY